MRFIVCFIFVFLFSTPYGYDSAHYTSMDSGVELSRRVAFAGVGGYTPFYLVELTTQEKHAIIFGLLEEAGLNFDSPLPEYTIAFPVLQTGLRIEPISETRFVHIGLDFLMPKEA